jgi:RHS repeat-associated protein
MLSVCVWDGDGGDNRWSNPANWRAGVTPSANDDLVFGLAALTETENDLPAGTAFRSLWFLSQDYSIAGNSLGVTSRILVGPWTAGATIAADLALLGAVEATIVGGPLSLSGVVSGSGSLTENGNGVLIVSAGATFTGNATIQDGATLRFACPDALPSGPSAGMVEVNGTLDLAGYSATVNGLSGDGLITSSATGPVTLSVDTTGQSTTFSGVIEDGAGRVALTTLGTGTLTLTGRNTLTGEVTVDAGSTLKLGSASALCADPEVNGTLDLAGYSTTLDGLWGSGTVTSSVAGAVTLTVDTTNYPGTFSGVIEDGSGTMSLAKTGAGTLTLAGANTYSGGTTISSGTLRVGSGGSSGTLGSGAVVNNAALEFYRSGTTTVANAISGSGTLTQTLGTLVLSGSNTYTGTTTIAPWSWDSATIQVGNGGTTGTLGSGTVTSSGDYESCAQLVYKRSDGVTVSNAVTGQVNVTIASGSTLKAGGSSACGLPNGTSGTGSVTISGTFDLAGYSPTVGNLSGSGTVTSGVSGTATLTVNCGGYESSTFPGLIEDGSGTVALAKTGSNNLYLTGANTYSGGTTISSGTLYVGSGGSSGTLGSGAVVNNAALEFYRSGTTTVANAISGSGTLTQTLGTLVLTGSNTYTGTTTIAVGATVRAAGTSGTLGTGQVTCEYDYPYYPAGELVFDRSANLTVGSVISGFLRLVQEGSGEVTLTGANTYTEGTTVGSGSTLRVGAGGTTGALGAAGDPYYGSGGVTVEAGGVLAFNRSDSATVSHAISGAGSIRQEGSGTLILTGTTSLGDAAISDGTLRVEGSVTVTNPLSNQGTLLVVGDGIFTHAGRRIAGGAASVSAGEVFLTSTGLGTETTTFDFEISADGLSYYPIASGGAADAQAMLSGLRPNTNYYLRGRAAHPGGGEEIYDGGMVTTGPGPGPGVADTSGYYRIVAIRGSGEYYGELIPQPGSTAYVTPSVLPAETRQTLMARDPQVQVFGLTGSTPPGSQNIFKLDHSWFFAESPQAAVLQAVVGLVSDQSTPIMIDGAITVYHITHYIDYQGLLADLWTFDAGKYPVGGYSEYWGCVPHTISVDGPLIPDPPCEDPDCCNGNGGPGGEAGSSCGGLGNSGGSSMPVSAIGSPGGAAACGLNQGGLTYSSRECSMDTGFGPGWSDADELPYLMGGEQNIVARFGSEQTVWFDAQGGGSYSARYGAKDALVHDSENNLFILTRSDGTRFEFFDYDQTSHPKGGLSRWVEAGGATIQVTAWTQAGSYYQQTQVIAEVVNKTTPNGQAHQKRTFTYWDSQSAAGRCGHVNTVTLSEYDGAAWTDVRRMTYDYYVTGNSYGLPGDLKTIVTQEWDAATQAWVGDDTNYFRYHTTNDVETGAVKHGLKRVLVPNAYAGFVSAHGDPADPQNPNGGDTQTDPISNFTCFYYEYDADHRVSDRIVFGKSNETDYTVSLSTNSRASNTWDRKTVETRLDGSTYTVYTNYLGQAILTDLHDPASQSHTLTYNRYDADGRLILTAQPSAFVLSGGVYYDEDLPDLIDFAGGDSPYLSNAGGLFEVTTYYASTSGGIDEDTAGAVKGYRRQTAVAHGEDAARLTVGAQGGPILLATTTYYARTVGDVTIYPTASQTVYANEDGTGAITTEYAYTWYSGTFQVQQQTITLPAVPTGQNGSGASAVRKQWFDGRGNLCWSMDELGRVTSRQYNPLSGRLAQTIEDIDAATAAALQLAPPAGWTLPASGGANLATDYQFDAFGRVTRTLGPAHTALVAGTPTSIRAAAWTFYNDVAHETRHAQGYATETSPGVWTTYAIAGPISITRTDRDGRTTEQIQAAYSSTLANLPSATILQSDYTAWTTYQYSKTRLVSTRVYDDIPSSGSGTEGTNYEQTSYGYETFGTGKMGRQNRTLAPDGTITRLVLDARGNALETWIGTNDENASDPYPQGIGPSDNNMVQVAERAYDASGNAISATQYADAVSGLTTTYEHDWRNRLTGALAPGDVVTHYELDNLGRTVWTKTYASADFTLSPGELRSQTQSLYDARGRVYESRVYEVDPDDGTVGDYLPSRTWYDARSQVVKTATGSGLFQKHAYDGLGRTVATYTSFDLDETAYADADDVTGDTVIEQTRTWYNQAGGPIATATFQRFPDDTSTTSALDAANSYATAAVTWYDGLGRAVATATYGREDVDSGLAHYFFNGTTGALIDTNTNGIPDAAEAAPPQPYPQDPNSLAGLDFQLSLTEYDSAGRAYRTIDNLGRTGETQFDDAGRTVRTIQNYVNGTVQETDTDCDLTVDYQYDSGGRLVTLTAYNAKGSGNGVQEQATKYLYTSTINASWQTAAVYPDSADVLSQDSTTKVWTITTDNGDHVSTSYDRLGRTTSTTDQRGVVREYTFDLAGRLAADTVTSLGASGLVDGSVRRIGTTYDDLGRVQTITSYSDTSGTTAVNQVQYVYNGWEKLAREYQEHAGTVDANTLHVDYTYAGGVARHVRLSQVTYPNGRQVQYDYGTIGAIDDIMSRLASIGDGTNTYAAYKYLGAGRIVTEDYEDIEVKLDYTGNDFAAFDRFGRVLDQIWTDYGADPDVVLDHYSYTYDRAGNRTSRNNELHSAFDEDYTYDRLDRLSAADRADAFDQSWTLDGLGNFSAFDDDGSSQTRTANGANEISAITGGWITPGYDQAGNMISGPKPGSGTTRVHYVYDAWNRLVEVRADDSGEPGGWIAEYEYDGTNRRIAKVVTGTSHAHYFYNQQWQMLEERFVAGQGATVASNQYVWSARYIDSAIVRFHDGDGDGDYLDAGDNIRYSMGDANYNVTATIDAGTGDVVQRYVYTAYGKATVYDGSWSNPAAPATDGPLYCGYFCDGETALYQVRNRYYDSTLSVFIGRDSIESDPNLYRYVGGNPITRFDPHGLSAREQDCIQDCVAGCDSEFGWYNPQRYICRSYCDNLCTHTPDVIDRVFSICPAINSFNNNLAPR